MFEVRRILKAFVDAQWLAEFDARLAAYRAQLQARRQREPAMNECSTVAATSPRRRAAVGLSPAAPGGLQLGHLRRPGLDARARRPQRPAHRRHRLGQVDAGRRRHHPAGARAAASPTTRPPAPRRASARCAPTCSATTSPSATRPSGAARPVALRDAQQLLGDPRRLPQRRLRPDRDAGPGVLAEGRRRASRRASSSSPSATLSHRRATSPTSAPTSPSCASGCAPLARRSYDSFPALRRAGFRRRFGIDNEQALELFHQTVSMKSVGNLTDFVRSHMLEPFDVAPRIAGADRALRRPEPRARGGAQGASARWRCCTPLVADCDRHADAGRGGRGAARLPRGAASLFRGAQARGCWTSAWQHLADESARHDSAGRAAGDATARAADAGARAASAPSPTTAAIASSAWRLEIARKERRADSVAPTRPSATTQLRQTLGCWRCTGADAFLAQRSACARRCARPLREREAALQNELTELGVAFAQGRQEHAELTQELTSLKARRSNIDAAADRDARARCAQALEPGRSATCPSPASCSRCATRSATGRAPPSGCCATSGCRCWCRTRITPPWREWVDRTHLSGRLVYFRVRDAKQPRDAADAAPRFAGAQAGHQAGLAVLRLAGTRAGAPLRRRLLRDARSSSAARRAPSPAPARSRAAASATRRTIATGSTTAAATCSAGATQAKIAALRSQGARSCEARLADVGSRIARLQKRAATGCAERLQALSKLDEYRDFDELDWQPLRRGDRALQRREAAAGVRLGRAQARWRSSCTSWTQALADTTDAELEASARTSARKRRAAHRRCRTCARHRRRLLDAPARRPTGPALRATRGAARRGAGRTHAHRRILRQPRAGHARLAAGTHRRRRQEAGAPGARRSSRRWPPTRRRSRSRRRRSTPASRPCGEYRKMLDTAERPTTCRASRRASRNCSTRTPSARWPTSSRSCTASARPIKERIALINESLTQIDYNPGRYIALEAQPATDAEIRDFQTDLRACTEGALTGSDDAQYSEAKFLQVKHIIERFRGREGSAELDRRWTAQGHRRAQLVRLRRHRALARGRQRARALHRLGRQVRRAEGEARLHHPGGQPGLPVRPGMGRGALALVPLRGHRRGLRPRLGRVGAVRAASCSRS